VTDTVTEAISPTVMLDLSAVRARKGLRDAADLLTHVRSLVPPSGTQRPDGQPRSKQQGSRLPFREDALEESDSVYAQLLDWTRSWADALTLPLPVTAGYAWSNQAGPQGFRSAVTPEGAHALTANLATWLLLHDDKIRRHPTAGTFYEDIADLMWNLSKKFPRESRGMRPVLPRPCPICGDPSMGVEWRSEQLLDFTLICTYCGFEGDTTALLKDRDVRTLMNDMRIEEAAEASSWWTKKQAAREMRITPQTLNRYIQRDGLKTHTADGTVYVNADQLRELWRGKRVGKLAINVATQGGARRESTM